MSARNVGGSLGTATLLVATALLTIGCGEPRPTRKPHPTPDKSTASRLMREALEKDTTFPETLCGPGTSALTGLELTLADNAIPGIFNAEVYATPQAAPTKRCEGVIAGIFDAVDRDADPLEFKLMKLDVLEVRTRGIEWKKEGR